MVMPLGAVNVAPMADWIGSIPFEDWPQQNPPGAELKPAMVSDPWWHGFGEFAGPLIAEIVAFFPGCFAYQTMLSVVMPGHDIAPHRDQQGPKWLTRVHAPLATNDLSAFLVEGVPHHMEIGQAYSVDTLRTHSVVNLGDTPRIHFMTDIGRPA